MNAGSDEQGALDRGRRDGGLVDPAEARSRDVPSAIEIRSPSTGAAESGDVAEASVDPVAIVRDRMHGRWLQAVLVGVLLGGGVAVAAWAFAPVKYVASALLRVEYKLDTISGEAGSVAAETGELDNYTQFVNEQALLMRDARVLDAVAARARGGAAPVPRDGGILTDGELGVIRGYLAGHSDLPGAAVLGKGLVTETDRNSGLIAVRFSAADPRLAAPVVNAVVDAYMAIHGPDSETDYARKTSALTDLITASRRLAESLEEERAALLKDAPYGSPNLERVLEDRVARMQRLEERLRENGDLRVRIREQAGVGDGEDPAEDATLAPTVPELDSIDPSLRELRRELEAARVEFSLLSKSYKPDHPAFARLARTVASLEARLDAARIGAASIWREGAGRDRSYGRLSREAAKYEAELSALRSEVDLINQLSMRAAQIDRKLEDNAAEEAMLRERIGALMRESESIRRGRVVVRQSATTPSLPDSDKRLQLAIVGFAGGVAAAFAGFFLLGSVRPSALHSSQFVGDRTVALLGVVPDMSRSEEIDGEAKMRATDCVHRLRNKIESRRTPGDGYALMVSSPFQGDGKTTVAAALALSYARSGHRTILVDCDLRGRALSHQFGHLRSPGVREVLQSGLLRAEVVSVGPNLALLPVGVTEQFSEHNLQIGSLRRLLRALRDRFEIIIVDTGPMTASVEAIPVAASCDGAVLAIRRGRLRARLADCIGEIRDTGAEYLGLVLNYATPADCDRHGSKSKISAEVSRGLLGEPSAPSRNPLLDMDGRGGESSPGDSGEAGRG